MESSEEDNGDSSSLCTSEHPDPLTLENQSEIAQFIPPPSVDQMDQVEDHISLPTKACAPKPTQSKSKLKSTKISGITVRQK